MRNLILSILIIINLWSIIELGTYGSTDFVQLVSLRVILAAVSFLLAVTYILVRGSKLMVTLSVVTAVIALSHFVYLIYVNI